MSRTRDTFAGGALAAWSTGLCAFRAGGGGAPRAETRRQRARRGVGEPVGAGGQGADVTQAPRRSPGGPGGSAGSESGLEMDCSPGLGPWSFARGGGGGWRSPPPLPGEAAVQIWSEEEHADRHTDGQKAGQGQSSCSAEQASDEGQETRERRGRWGGLGRERGWTGAGEGGWGGLWCSCPGRMRAHRLTVSATGSTLFGTTRGRGLGPARGMGARVLVGPPSVSLWVPEAPGALSGWLGRSRRVSSPHRERWPPVASTGPVMFSEVFSPDSPRTVLRDRRPRPDLWDPC